MSQALAMTAPIDPWETARQWGGPAVLLALFGWLSRQAIAWRKRRRLAREKYALEAKAVRYLLDAQRHALHLLIPNTDGHRLVDLDELARQKILIDTVRDELWVLDGHQSQRATEEAAAEILRILTRTQAIQAKQLAEAEAGSVGQPPMFQDDGKKE